MQLLRILGICAALCVAAMGIGLMVVSVVGTSGALSVSSMTPTPPVIVQTAAPTGFPTEPAATIPAATSVPPPTPSPAATDIPTPPPAATDIPTPPPAPEATAVAEPGYIEYTVQKGDILYTLAQRFGVTIEDILAVNSIPNPESLRVGEVIRIPIK